MTRHQSYPAATPGNADLAGLADRLGGILAPPRWMRLAACRLEHTELFFPDDGNLAAAAEARKICSGCPVWRPCRLYGLNNPKLEGVWGGLTDRQRRAWHKNQQKRAVA